MFSVSSQLLWLSLGALCGLSLVSAFTGDVTFYDLEMGTTACGQKYTGNDYVAALAHEMFDSGSVGGDTNPNHNSFCNKTLKATYQGKSVIVSAVDRCGDCEIKGSIDLSRTAFRVLADTGLGRLHEVEWEWFTGTPGPVEGAPAPKDNNDSGDQDPDVKRSIRRRSTPDNPVNTPVYPRRSGSATSAHKFAVRMAKPGLEPHVPKRRMERRRIARSPIVARRASGSTVISDAV